MMKIRVAIADDHQLLLKGLALMISNFHGVEVVFEALNGEELLNKISQSAMKPDIVLVDVQMPVMDGMEAATLISERYPDILLAALSSKEDDATIIKMIRAGCCAYLQKDMHPDELEKAILEIQHTGYYNADGTNIRYRRLVREAMKDDALRITTNEKIFLQLAATDLIYKQIAAKMFLSVRTIDGYRESLFEKLNVESRVGMVLEGIRKGIITL